MLSDATSAYSSCYYTVQPLIGVQMGRSSKLLHAKLLFQPEIIAMPPEPVIFHGTMSFAFFPQRRVSPLLTLSGSIASNDVQKSHPEDSQSIRITPSILFS